MKTHLDEFITSMADIERYIQVSDHVRGTLSSDSTVAIKLGGDVGSHVQVRRLFDHHAVIILLYGALERFVENLAMGYVEYLSQNMVYRDIPEKLRDTHVELSARILATGRREKKYGTIDSKDVIEKLHSCVVETPNYKMNVSAFTHHAANFRHEEVDSFFSRLDLDKVSDSARKQIPLKEWLRIDKGLPGVAQEVPVSTIKELLDGLADRRNEVAHGRWDTELLGRDDLIRHVNFLCAYGQSLYDIVFRAALKIAHLEGGQRKAPLLGKPIIVFNSKIVCLHLQGVTVRIGSKLAAKLPDGGYRWGKVVNLQCDRSPIEFVLPDQSLDVGIEVDFEAKDNQTYYLLDEFV